MTIEDEEERRFLPDKYKNANGNGKDVAEAWKGAAIVNRRDTNRETRENRNSNMIRLEEGRRRNWCSDVRSDAPSYRIIGLRTGFDQVNSKSYAEKHPLYFFFSFSFLILSH